MRVQADVRSDTDTLIAVGWCKSKFGAALMRLQAEWDGAERLGIKVPLKPTKRAIMAEAQVTMKGGIRRITTQSMEAARKKLESYYEAEMRKLAVALKSLPEVITMLELKLLLDGQSAELAAPLVLYWLDPVCRVCHGAKYQMAPCKTKLSERACGCCAGEGVVKPPAGEIGLESMDLMNSCVLRAGGEVRNACRY
ncbi:hypothetical protein [Comamonas kerstersii]|uniref:hypothetical protein n=1 Tax=Comamonas kerstersii TaxID=225992 RepID=UPI001B333CDA|nr:hypothetical protein [Comamonas kerstersii]QTW20232.1 hypothetical protein H8N02_07395 [Comamonas kerstersii]